MDMQVMTRWRLAGYDQFMNIVLDNTVEIVSPTEKNEIGMVVIRGPWTTPLAISIVGPECISPYCHLCLHIKADSDAVYLETGGVEGWNKDKHGMTILPSTFWLNEQMEVGICIPSAPPHLFASPTCLRKQHHDVGVLGQSEVMDALRIPGF